jgi:DDE superfamily endonuclease/Tc5 transposase DNA-binding domain
MSDEARRKKRGPAAGTTYNNNKRKKDWFIACETYDQLSTKVTMREFLRSAQSGSNFSGTDSEVVSFSRYFKRYKSGCLQPSESIRLKTSSFPDVETKLIAYIELRARYYKRDKCGVSYSLLKEKANKFAEDLNIKDFKASNGWLHRTLKRHGKVGIALHGEADDIPIEERNNIVDDWKKNVFHPLIQNLNVSPACIYNADQTGLFYQKLPNKIYVDKSSKKKYAGAKQMKDKNRITVMICTAADGSKVPLSIVGKSKNPVCFRICESSNPPLPYVDQANAWFDQRVTIWWLTNVFIPFHRRKFGDSACILILDNCPAHSIDASILPSWCHVVFLPPNMTSNFQPADMGMIANLKIGYKATMLHKLLEIFDHEGGYEGAANMRKTVRRGQRGLAFGGKATILDAMNILNSIWRVDGRYAKEDGIRRCWRKASILPLHMNTTIDAELGRASTSLNCRILKKEDCDELCELMTMLKVKATTDLLDCDKAGVAFKDSFVSEADQYTAENYNEMIHNWICIEDEEEVMNAVCNQEIEELESNAKPDDSPDDDEQEVQPMEIDEESDFVSYVEAVDFLVRLKQSAPKLGVNDATTVHLDRFLRALHTSNAKKSRRDTTLHEFFARK